jgi:anaerobic magnesium-protoporphyrin IX monomethyl ester cyclase
VAVADLLLSHGYFLAEDEKEQRIMRPYPPLGLLYLSAYLKRAGLGVSIFDATLATREAFAATLAARTAPVLGLYTNLMTRRSVLDMIAAATRHGWTVVLGGPESANYPGEYLARGADVVVIGEGEQTLAELLPAIAARGVHRLHAVDGIAFRDEAGAVVRTSPRALVPDLDSLPWPDRAAIDLPAYVDIWRRHHGRGSVNLITARGCAYRCNWCSHAVYGYTHRRRRPADCADEVAHIVETYAPDQLWYADDVFTIHPKWIADYAAEIRRRDLVRPFETISRADRMLQPGVIEALAALGCYRVWIGAESGSQRLLDAMERRVTRAQVEAASHAAQRHGIEVGMFLMWGYDGETIDDIAQTIDLVKRAAPTVALTTLAYPIAGTGYFTKVQDRVSLPRAWDDCTDRDYAIAGRRDRAYYSLADAWLRREIDAQRAVDDAPRAAEMRAAAAAARLALEQADQVPAPVAVTP